jgi:hypothetical protein
MLKHHIEASCPIIQSTVAYLVKANTKVSRMVDT